MKLAILNKLKSGIDIKYILKNGFWLGSYQVINVFLSFFIIVIISNYGSQETLGMYTYVISTIAIISSFTLTGLNTTSTQAVAKGYDGTIVYSHNMLLRWGLLICTAAFLIAGYYFIRGNVVLAISFIIPGILTPLYTASQQYTALLSGKKEFFVLAITNSLILLSSVVVLLIVINKTDLLPYIILSILLTNTLLSYIAFRLLKQKYVKNNMVEEDTLPYSKHLSVMNVFPILSGNIDKLLIYHFLGPYQLAVYFLATTPVLKLRIADQVIAALAVPKMAHKKISELKKTLPLKVLMLSFLLLLLSGFYIICAPFLFQIIFPASMDSVIYSQVFSTILVLMSSILYTQALTINRCKRELYIVKTSIPTIRIVLFLVLIPIYGIWGIIAALILAQLINFILLWYFFYRASDLQPNATSLQN